MPGVAYNFRRRMGWPHSPIPAKPLMQHPGQRITKKGDAQLIRKSNSSLRMRTSMSTATTASKRNAQSRRSSTSTLCAGDGRSYRTGRSKLQWDKFLPPTAIGNLGVAAGGRRQCPAAAAGAGRSRSRRRNRRAKKSGVVGSRNHASSYFLRFAAAVASVHFQPCPTSSLYMLNFLLNFLHEQASASPANLAISATERRLGICC